MPTEKGKSDDELLTYQKEIERMMEENKGMVVIEHGRMGSKSFLQSRDDKDLDRFEFKCYKCFKVHKMSMYAVAQLASGNAMLYNCDCGEKTELYLK